MGFFRKKEPVKLDPLTPEEKEQYEAIKRRQSALRRMINHITSEQADVIESLEEFWDEVARARDLDLRESRDWTLEFTKDGEVLKRWK